MKNLQNLHTHSTYCDGVDTPEEMVKIAISKGFDSLGFSGHAPNQYSNYAGINEERTEAYKEEIARLKEKYKGVFPIFLGLEYEMYSGYKAEGFDYLIGSLHYLNTPNGTFVGFDRDAKCVENIINEHFGGDGLKFAEEYYRQVALLPNYGAFDILGHFDIITKNIEIQKFFDTNDLRYKNAALQALENLLGKIPFFEVNTGAISRGYRTSPYPEFALLKAFKDFGFRAIISSDCHNGEYLDCAFKEAKELLIACGFKERYVLTENGFCAVEI